MKQQFRKITSFLLFRLLPKLLFFLSYILSSTLRTTTVNQEAERTLLDQGKSIIYSSWHGQFLFLSYFYRWRSDINNLISPSSDGEFIANFNELLGMKSIRGSSFKKPRETLYAMKRCIDSHEHVFSIADGSRGPYQKLQQGTPLLARMTGSPIVFIAIDYSHQFVCPSWDRFQLPLPFSRAAIVYSDPIYVEREFEGDGFRDKVKEIEGIFLKTTWKAAEIVRGDKSSPKGTDSVS